MKGKNRFAIIGFKNCGKSTFGKFLAKKMNFDFLDLDDEITKIVGKTPREICDENPADFEKIERQVVQKYAALEKIVIATGGAFCQNEGAVQILKKSGFCFIFLDVEKSILFERLQNNAKIERRYPSFITSKNPRGNADIAAIFSETYNLRRPNYVKFADKVISDQNGAEKIAE